MSSDKISVKMKKDKSVKKRFIIVNRPLSTIFILFIIQVKRLANIAAVIEKFKLYISYPDKLFLGYMKRL